jgi:hypothetical protein
MPDTRINVPMDNQEFTALLSMAKADCRHPREQLRYLLREAAQARGLLPQSNESTDRAIHVARKPCGMMRHQDTSVY